MDAHLGYLPKLACFGWDRTLLWLQVAPNLLTMCALVVLCIALFRVAVARTVVHKDFGMLLVYFSTIAIFLGVVLNLGMETITLRFPWYEVQATVKLVTAVVTLVGVTIVATTLSAGLSTRALHIETALAVHAPSPAVMTQENVDRLQSLVSLEEATTNSENTQQILSNMNALLDEQIAKSEESS